jgi:hypothetical protein
LAVIPVDLYKNNIFEVFNITIEKIKKRQQFLKRKFSLFSINLHRILTIFFNLYRHKYNPDLYGNLQRKYLSLGLVFIFDYYVNDQGEMIYYLKFMCEPKTRSWWRFKHETGSRYGEYISRTWNKSIDIDFIHYTEEQNLKNTGIHQKVYWKNDIKEI